MKWARRSVTAVPREEDYGIATDWEGWEYMLGCEMWGSVDAYFIWLLNHQHDSPIALQRYERAKAILDERVESAGTGIYRNGQFVLPEGADVAVLPDGRHVRAGEHFDSGGSGAGSGIVRVVRQPRRRRRQIPDLWDEDPDFRG